MSKKVRLHVMLICVAIQVALPLKKLHESVFFVPSTYGETGGTIYFSTFHDYVNYFYSIDPDGNDLQFLVQSTYGRFRPSPDGTRIALALHRSGTLVEGEYDLYLMEIDQGNLIQLTQTGNSHSQIWSPSGDYITFVLEEEGQSTIISAPIEEPSSLTPLISSTDLLGNLEWAPDEQFLLFRACDDNFVCHVYSVNADGTGLRNLTEGFVGTVSEAALSPDAQSLAFVASMSTDLASTDYIPYLDIYTLDLAEETVSKITDASAEYYFLDWDPNGDWLAYTSNWDGDWDLYLTNFNTMSNINLTQNSDRQDGVYGLDWSPDGSQIVYTAGPIGGDFELFITDVEGTDFTQLTDNDLHDGDPIWLD